MAEVKLIEIKTPVGTLWAGEREGAVSALSAERPDGKMCETPLLLRVKLQLSEYFAGARQSFDLPLNPEGTEFQQRVWRALCNIGYGKTASYGDIARAVGSPKAARAVGGACNKNPVMIIIPCHRVIGAQGRLTGFAFGLEMKEKLLEIEAHSACSEKS